MLWSWKGFLLPAMWMMMLLQKMRLSPQSHCMEESAWFSTCSLPHRLGNMVDYMGSLAPECCGKWCSVSSAWYQWHSTGTPGSPTPVWLFSQTIHNCHFGGMCFSNSTDSRICSGFNSHKLPASPMIYLCFFRPGLLPDITSLNETAYPVSTIKAMFWDPICPCKQQEEDAALVVSRVWITTSSGAFLVHFRTCACMP